MDSGDNVSDKGLHFNIPIPRQNQRFREMILYVSEQSVNDLYFGAIKLNKILYYSDFRSFEKFGTPLTGVTYFRLPQGPAPKPLLHFRNDLVAEGALRIEQVPIGEKMQIRTIALRKPVLSHFSADEIFLVDQVISELWSQNATEVSDASHDVRWRVLRHRDPLPYEFAFLETGELMPADRDRTTELALELGW